MYAICFKNNIKIAQCCKDMSIDIDKFKKLLYNVINVNTTNKGCIVSINRNPKISNRSLYGAIASINYGSQHTGLPTGIFDKGFEEIKRNLPAICRNYQGEFLP